MSNERVMRRLLSGSVAALVLGLAALFGSPAHAAPSPAIGPTAGGTTVSDQVPAVSFTQIAGGVSTSYGLGSDGAIYAWGLNDNGQVGDGTTTTRLSPVPVDVSGLPPASQPFAQIAAGGNDGYALGGDGVLYGWGWNNSGQVGDGTTTTRLAPVPVDVSGLPPASQPFTQIAGGGYAGYALGSDGVLYAWGANIYGGIGDGTTTTRLAPVPVDVSGLPPASQPFTQIAGGSFSGYALGSDGVLYAWGWNNLGQLGDGTATNRSTPAPVDVSGLPPASQPFTQIAAGAQSGYGLGSDGVLYAWGANTRNQLADGTATNRSTPAPVSVGTLPPASQPFAQIAAGGYSGYALGGDGVLYAWGWNAYGQVGDGSTMNRSTPVPVSVAGLPSAAQPFARIAGGADVGYALDGDGLAYAWGHNNAGQVGDGSTTNRTAPAPVDMAAIVTSVAFGAAAGTNLSAQPNGAWSATTPPGCGVADVVVNWTQFGAPHSTTYTGGFTFGAPPAITAQPSSGTVAAGGAFAASVAVSGDDAPAIQWQQLGTDGTWSDVPGATGEALSVPSLSATRSYRAVATNCWGAAAAATSAVAVATVPPAPRTVTFDANAPADQVAGAMPDQIANAPTALRMNAFSRAGYLFLGWNTAADGTGAAYPDGAEFAFAADATLFAQWAPAPAPPAGGNDLAATGAPGTAGLLLAGGALLLTGTILLLLSGTRRREAGADPLRRAAAE